MNQVGILRGGLDSAMRLIGEERRKVLYLVEVLVRFHGLFCSVRITVHGLLF